MKRGFTKLMAALALLLFIVPPMVGWGQTSNEVTYTFSQHYNANTTLTDVAIAFDDNITATFHKGSGSTAPQYYTNGTAVRWYGGNTLDITATNATISAIEFTYTQKNKDVTADVGEYNHDEGTWTGSESSVTFTVASGSGHNRVSEIKVTYTTSGGTPAPSITASNVEIAYDATEGAIGYTITNGVDGGVLSAATEAEWLTIGTVGETVPFTCSVNDNGERVATVTLTYTYDTDQTVTKNVTVTQATNPNGPGSEANPYTVAQARAAIDAGTGTQGVYATGIVSAIPTAWNTQYNNITFNFVDNQGDTDFLQAYRCVSGSGVDASTVAVGDVVVVYGDLTKYGSTYEFAQNCQVVSLEHPVSTDPSITVDPAVVNVDAEEHDGTLTLAYENLTITEMGDFDIQYYDAEGEELTENPEWIEVLVAEQDPQIGEGYVVSYYMLENDGEARTAYFKVYAMDDETNLVYSNLVTVNQEAYVAPVPSITITPDVVNLDAGEHYVNLLDLAYENIEVEGPSSFTVHYYNAEGEEIELVQGEAWLIAGVVLEDDVYQVLYAVVANYGEARTAYFKVSCGETYSNLVTVTQAAPVLDYAVLPFVWAGGSSADFAALNGVTLSGNGSDYNSNHAPYLIKFDGTGDYIQVKTNGQPGLVTIGVKMIGGSNTSTITIQGSADGETFTDIEELTISGAQNDTLTLETTNAFDANDRYVRMLFTKGSNVGVGPITIAQGTAPSINIAPANFDLEAVGDLNGMQVASGFVTYNNIDITQDSDFHIQFYNAEGVEQNQPEWILGAAVSQIANSYQVACMVGPNTGAARSTYYKVYAFDADSNPVYSNLVTINQAGVPQPSITVTPDVVNVDAEEHDGTLALAYENLTITEMGDFDIQYYDAEGEELTENPDWIEVLVAGQDPTIGEGYVVSYIMNENNGEARSAYFKVYAMDDETNLVYSNLVTVNQAAYVAPALDYAELPFEFDGGRADIETTDGLTQEGLDSDYSSSPKLKFNTTGDWLLLHFNEVPGILTFDIKGNGSPWDGTFTVQTSEDGETYENMDEYTELGGTETKTIDNLGENVRYIKWIYTNKTSGNVALGNITLAQPAAPVASITVEFDEIEVTATGEDDYAAITYENLEITQASDFDIQFYNAAGAPLDEQPDWMSAEVTTQIGEEGYFVYYVIDDNEGEARTAYFKVYALDANAELVYSNLVTVSQEAYEVPVDEQQFALYGGNLVEGDYIIYYNGKAMNNVVSSGRLQYAEIEPEDNVITTDNAAIVWHIAQNADGYWTIYSADANAYAASTGVKNKAQMLEDGTDDMAMWTVSEISGTYEFVNKANAAGDINANLRNNGTYGFACYATGTGGALSLYKYTETISTHTLEIAGYGTSDGGYYLIASPVLGVTPTIENGFLTDAYDLYYFDQAEEESWRNYEVKPFNIASGKGYLYASQEPTTLTFTGIPYEGNGDIALDYDEDAPFGGWNLIGNPFSTTATLDHDFYILNPDGSELVASESEEVYPMQGVFVQADATNQIAHFNNGTTGTTPGVIEDKLNLRVSNDNGIGDFARIRFGEGHNLEKFQLNPNSTKLYFPQGENDYAVVCSTNEGEMPVNFKAAENGTYTLSINPENVIIDYLHLIDNMTGMDIDLLQTPDYSFEATVNDNAARFTLVFAGLTGVEENNANSFAFFNGSEWVINNMGEASLQMVDMTGRIVSSANINGNATLHTDNLSAGAYVIRLVNGENVKSQKVIIK